MKTLSRFVMLALLALLISAAGCGKKDDADDSSAKDAAGTTKTDGSAAKESGKSSPGGFGK